MHGCLLDPDRTAPSTANQAARQFTEGQVSTCMPPIAPRYAYGRAAQRRYRTFPGVAIELPELTPTAPTE